MAKLRKIKAARRWPFSEMIDLWADRELETIPAPTRRPIHDEGNHPSSGASPEGGAFATSPAHTGASPGRAPLKTNAADAAP